MLPPRRVHVRRGVRVGAAELLRRRVDVRGRSVAAPRAGRAARGRHRQRRGAAHLRGEDGVVRAFANTCRHRGHELLPCGSIGDREGHRLPVPLVGVLAVRRAARRAGIPRRARLRRRRLAAAAAAGRRVARAGVRRRVRRRGRAAAAGRARARSSRRTSRSGWSRSRDAHLRRRGELEDPHRELPRVLSLPDDPPGAVQRVARRTAARTTRRPGPGSAAGWSCATAPPRCRWTGTAAACRCAGLSDEELRTVAYVGDLPERAAQPAPGLRDDARPGAVGGGPDADRVHVGVRAGGGSRGPASTRPTPSTSGT